ncbi:MAG TPA: nicotinamide-nucleotide adenylyltransferase [Nitrososphaera sp.]
MEGTALFIGRFQPFHLGHLATVRFALGKAKVLVIVVGSAQKSHEPRNPFTSGERIRMIKETLNAEKIDANRIMIVPVPDVGDHSRWTHKVDELVPEYDLVIANDPFTLMLFRERGIRVLQAPLYRRSEMAATEIRKMMREDKRGWEKMVSVPVHKILKEIDGVNRVKAIAEKDVNEDHSA